MGKVVCQQFLFPLQSILWCSNNGNHLQEQLAKFGREESEKFKNLMREVPPLLLKWIAGV
jgi:hypothetical protein